MRGSIALVGSGEYLPAMAEFERSLIADGIKNGKDPLFLQIPTAAGREGRERLSYWQQLGRSQADALRVEQVFLPIYERADAVEFDQDELLDRSALIYISGGDPHHLANALRGTPLFDALARAWRSGSSLAGCSAGAMVMSSYVPHFRFSRNDPTPGLGLMPKVRVIPHFDKFFRWIPDSAAQRLMQTKSDEILLGIDELTALVRRLDEELWEVQGESKVHILHGMPHAQLSRGERLSLAMTY